MENKQAKDVSHAVRYDHFGGTDVLYIAEQPVKQPKDSEVQVQVKAAGINPGEGSIREGKLQKEFPSTFPSGQGSDFAGVVTAVGEKVTHLKPGDEVIGFSNDRNSHAESVVVPEEQVTPRPKGVSWEQAGGLFVVGSTAYAAVKAVNIKAGEILIVSGAAGGVGSVAVQLAHNIGAKVIGIAGKDHHDWLEAHGVIVITHDDDMEEQLEKALDGKKPDALIDTFGKGYVDLGIKLGIPKDRIDTIIDFAAAQKHGVKTAGSSEAANSKVLAELAQMINEGKLEIPVAKTYPLSEVKKAYEDLEQRHTQGKIVLIP